MDHLVRANGRVGGQGARPVLVVGPGVGAVPQPVPQGQFEAGPRRPPDGGQAPEANDPVEKDHGHGRRWVHSVRDEQRRH